MNTETDTLHRDLTPAARRILDVASDLFYRHGIRAVGVDTIAREANVTKKTIYDRFGSKDALVAAYLRTRDRYWHGLIDEKVNMPGYGPRDRILAMFEILDVQMRDRGCAFINAHAELSEEDVASFRMVRESKVWLQEFFQRELETIGVANPDALAAQLVMLHEGTYITYAMAGVNDAPHLARQAAEVLLDAAPSA